MSASGTVEWIARRWPSVGIKPGVRLDGLDLQRMAPVIESVADEFSARHVQPMITSGLDGHHKKGSLHYDGRALDWRTRDLRKWERKPAAKKIRAMLGRDYDVVLESTHLHIEYDPKGGGMDDKKHWFASKGVLGGVAAMIGGLGMLVGIDIDQTALGEALAVAASVIGGLVSALGRVVATKRIG